MVFHVAIIGGGISGACAAQYISSQAQSAVLVDVYDQGRGPGGRASSRTASKELQFNHGCQFFRADTPYMRQLVSQWEEDGLAKQLEGNFYSDGDADFFGMPSFPPFYVGVPGMNAVPAGVLESLRRRDSIRLFSGVRVERVRHTDSGKWHLHGKSGEAAYHDTEEAVARRAESEALGNGQSYDALICTDVSSSFDHWHRASAGLPIEFSKKVTERVGARVPLFTCMVAFKHSLPINYQSLVFKDTENVLWFAGSTHGESNKNEGQQCWVLVSTAAYALKEITDTPMQNPLTGEFIPQSPDYLTSKPAPDLLAAFKRLLADRFGKLFNDFEFPEVAYINAQRWGSALPCQRHLREKSYTREIICNVAYDGGDMSMPLAPTRDLSRTESEGLQNMHHVFDEQLMIFQCGDMVSSFTPGFEAAALSGIEAAQHVLASLKVEVAARK